MGKMGRYRVSSWLTCIILLGAFAACSDDNDPMEPEPPDRALEGSWSRVNSSFLELDGMVVLVNNTETEGVITSTPANVFMFENGDLKWRSIVRTAVGSYTFEDLVREANTGTQSYVAGEISVSADGDSLAVTFPTTGTFQEWLRVN